MSESENMGQHWALLIVCMILTCGFCVVGYQHCALKERVTELERCQWQAAPVPPAQVMKGGEG